MSIQNPSFSQLKQTLLYGTNEQTGLAEPVYGANGRMSVGVDASQFPQSQTYTRTMFQGTSVATGTPAGTYTVALDSIDISTAVIVLVTSAGTVTVDGQVSYDGVTNPVPGTPFTLFSAVTVGTYSVELSAVTNFVYGHVMTGDIDISGAASDIELYLMAQGK
jgi:asparagine N-glycosylation enzyme membrane subunit Stt3